MPNELVSCDKDFCYVRLTRGLTCGRYGDLGHDTQGYVICITVSETTPEDHVIFLHDFLTGNKAHATIALKKEQLRANYSRMQVNCLRASVKLHLSCTSHVTYV